MAQKLAGEKAVMRTQRGRMQSCARLGWCLAHGAKFRETMLRLGARARALDNREAIRSADLTPAADIAAPCWTMGMTGLSMTGAPSPGTYHFSGAPDVSWRLLPVKYSRQAGLTTQWSRNIPTFGPIPALPAVREFAAMDCAP